MTRARSATPLRWLRLTALAIGLSGALLSPSAEAAGEVAPAFTLRDIDGKTVNLADYQGKVVLLQFWATWCGPCQAEMPHLQKMYTELGPKGFVVLSISIDDARASSMVKPIIKKNGYTFPVLLDKDTSVVTKYNPTKSVPYAVVVDKAGKIASVHLGYNPGDEVALKSEISALLAAP